MSDAHIVNLLSQEGFALLARKRNETIEECARMADREANTSDDPVCRAKIWRVGSAIRALKENVA